MAPGAPESLCHPLYVLTSLSLIPAPAGGPLEPGPSVTSFSPSHAGTASRFSPWGISGAGVGLRHPLVEANPRG